MNKKFRLTALLLALLMLFQSVAVAETSLNDLTKSVYDGYVAEAQLVAEDTLVERTLTAQDQNFNFAIEGEMPKAAELYVTYLGADSTSNIRENILGLGTLDEGAADYAFDITIVDDNAPWQPETPVEVTITGLDVTADSEVKVYHIPDSQPAVATLSLMDDEPAATMQYEEVSATAGDGAVTFVADGFSIYYVVNGERGEQIANNSTVFMEIGETQTFTSNYSGNQSSSWTVDGDEGSFETTINGNTITVTAVSGGTVQLRYGYTSWLWTFYGDQISVSSPYTVRFESNGGTGSYQMRTGSNGAFVFPTIAEAGITAPEGMEFAGWSTDASGKGNTYSSGIEQSVSNNSTVFYALWYNPSSTETVSAYFHIRIDGRIPYEPELNQGITNYTTQHALTGTIKNPVAINNNLSAVAANIATAPTNAQINAVRANTVGTGQKVVWYVIKWDTHNSNKRGDWHVDGIVMDEDEYLVTYHPNGGNTSVPAAEAYFPDASVTVDYSPLPERIGYDFLGWSEDPNAKTPTYSNKSNPETFSMPSHDVNLYAVWKPANGIAYTVEHYWCDADGQNPELHETETLYGTTEEVVTAEYKTYAGYAPYPEHAGTDHTGTVAADGSLVLKLYYKQSNGSLTITKTVIDENNIYTNTDRTFTFTVTDKDGNIVKDGDSETWSITVPANDEDGIASITIPNLTTGNYTVTEAAYGGYTTTVTATTQGTDDKGNVYGTVTVPAGGVTEVAFTNTVVTKDVTVTKVWNDESNKYNLRPEEITVYLRTDSAAYSKQLTIEGTNVDKWTGTFQNVAMFDAAGNALTYTVSEATVDNYDTTYVPEDGAVDFTVEAPAVTITNTLQRTTLTIKKAGMKDIDAGQSFLFKVTSTGGVNLTIAINGNGSETISGLTVGDTVTVTEVESWSWRYTAEPTTIPLKPNDNVVTISNTRDNPYWLDGDCYAENVFGTITTAE